MQGRFKAADNITPSRRDRDAIVMSQCIDSFLFCINACTLKAF